jgi:hypothetical protein
LISYMDAFRLLAVLNGACILLVVVTIRRKKAAAAGGAGGAAGAGGVPAQGAAPRIELEAH